MARKTADLTAVSLPVHINERWFNAAHRTWLYVLATLVLQSCAIAHDYPASWPPRATTFTQDTCPDLSGTYKTSGELSAEGPPPGNSFLIDYLCAEGGLYNPWLENHPEPRRALHPLINAASSVEIAQPTPETLEVIIWGGHGTGRFILRRDVLSARDGDFSCDISGLSLRRIYSYKPGLWLGNMLWWEERILGRADDGSLVMKFTRSGFGHHLVFPRGGSVSYWLRWEALREEGGSSR